MTAEYSAGNGGEHARQLEHESIQRMLLRTIGQPIAAKYGDEIAAIGINHGVHEGQVWIRNGTGELGTYGLDEFTFIAGDKSELAEYLKDILPDTLNPDTI